MLSRYDPGMMNQEEAIQKIISFICDDEEINEFIHAHAQRVLGWVPESDEDEDHPLYPAYWEIRSSAAMILLAHASSSMIHAPDGGCMRQGVPREGGARCYA